jgi:hypothetical protein
MRFIDLFMAAFGSLVFMTMVLVAIVSRMPSEPSTVPTSVQSGQRELELLTKGMPAAQVGSQYEEALAIRGGRGPYTWQLIAGSLPAGIAFDAKDGIFSGSPAAPATAQILVRVRDTASSSTERAYTLTVVQPAVSGRMARWAPYVIATLLGLLALATLANASGVSRQIAFLDEAAAAGHITVTFNQGAGVTEEVDVREGRETKVNERRIGQFVGIVFLILSLLVAIYIVVTRFVH